MDYLQGNTSFHTTGEKTIRLDVGILTDDTDGEFYIKGVVRQLEVRQRKTMEVPRIKLAIEEIAFQ